MYKSSFKKEPHVCWDNYKEFLGSSPSPLVRPDHVNLATLWGNSFLPHQSKFRRLEYELGLNKRLV